MPRESAEWCPTPSGSGKLPGSLPRAPPCRSSRGAVARVGAEPPSSSGARGAPRARGLLLSRVEGRGRGRPAGNAGEAGSLGPASRAGVLVPKGGLEPPRIAPYAPQAYVSTNSTTSATWVGTLDPGRSKGSVIINMRRRDRKMGTTGRLVRRRNSRCRVGRGLGLTCRRRFARLVQPGGRGRRLLRRGRGCARLARGGRHVRDHGPLGHRGPEEAQRQGGDHKHRGGAGGDLGQERRGAAGAEGGLGAGPAESAREVLAFALLGEHHEDQEQAHQYVDDAEQNRQHFLLSPLESADAGEGRAVEAPSSHQSSL